MDLNTLHPIYESTVKKAFTNISVSFHFSSSPKLKRFFVLQIKQNTKDWTKRVYTN